MYKFISLILIISTVLFTACQKISVPTADAEKIFGSWNYVTNSGGYSGGGGSTRFCADCWAEFTENGCFTVYNGSDKVSKRKFKLEMKESIYNSNLRPAIVYRNSDYETFQVFGDTLVLADEKYDGYSYLFVKK